ncbi:hypothetical protein WDU94_015452 [Cyamophila willieti]
MEVFSLPRATISWRFSPCQEQQCSWRSSFCQGNDSMEVFSLPRAMMSMVVFSLPFRATTSMMIFLDPF